MDRYQTTFRTYNKIAALYQDKFMDMDLYNDTYSLFCELIVQPGAQILEMACGPGNITRHLVAQRPDFRICAIDIAPNMLRLAKDNNPSVDFQLMDCREIGRLAPGFDGIICGFGLPYLSKEDTAGWIKDCSFLLNSGGILYFSTAEGDYHQSGYETGSTGDKVYFYYHESGYLLAYLKENNFELIDLLRKYYPQNDGTSQVHLIIIAKKK